MNVPFWVWAATIVGLLAVLASISDRRPPPPRGERPRGRRWVAVYSPWPCSSASACCLRRQEPATAFFAGYLTEYSLSVDNLFVFVLIMGAFAVPRELPAPGAAVGILIALVLRGAFIPAGAAVIARFSWVFYLFGAFLVSPRIKVVPGGDEDEEFNARTPRCVRRCVRR